MQKQNLDSLWPNYNSFERPFNGLLENATLEFVKQRSSVSLDLLPYLKSVSETSFQRANYTSQSARSNNNHQNATQRQTLEPLGEWFNCLSDLNVAIGRWKESISNPSDSLAQVRLREEAQCLASSELRLRLKVRRSAFDDLETLLLNNGSSNARLSPKSNELLRVLHEASSSKSVLVATRNLADGSAGSSPLMESDLMESLSFGLDQPTLSSTNATSNSFMSIGGSSQTSTTSTSGLVTSSNSSTSTGLRGFLAKAYKDAIGKALAMVVGTGLMIFMLNLIIVLVISIRSRQSRNRCAVRDANTSNNDGKLVLNQQQRAMSATVSFDKQQDQCPGEQQSFANQLNQSTLSQTANFPMHVVAGGNSYMSSSISSATSFVVKPNQEHWHETSGGQRAAADISFVASSTESNSNGVRVDVAGGGGGGSGSCKQGSRNKQLKFDLLNAPKRHEADSSRRPILANRYVVPVPYDMQPDTDGMIVQRAVFSSSSSSAQADNYVATTTTMAANVGTSPATFKLDHATTMATTNELNSTSASCQHHSFGDNNSNSQSSPTTNHTTTNNSIGIGSINISTQSRQPVQSTMPTTTTTTGVPMYSTTSCVQTAPPNAATLCDGLNYAPPAACLYHQCTETGALLSATSPSSSTTLSLTPMQLEQLVVHGTTNATHTSGQQTCPSSATQLATSDACDFQIEPIGFLCTVSQQASAMSSPNDPIGYESRSDRLNWRPM